MKVTLLALTAALLATPALAQDAPEAPAERPALVRALDLPIRAQEVRELGAPEADVRGLLEKAREGKMSAGESAEMLEVEAEAAREHGNIDNFGAFVGAKLDEGLRGQDLAAAIRAEHEARGKGKPDHAGGPPEGKGKPDGAGAPEGKGKGEEAGSAKAGKAGGPTNRIGSGKGSKGPAKATKTRPTGE